MARNYSSYDPARKEGVPFDFPVNSAGLGSAIVDDNGNEQLIFNTTASAVNHVRLTNAATGNAPALRAQGDDTNVDLQLSGKGSGEVFVGSSSTDEVANGSATINAMRGVVTIPSLSAGTSSTESFDLVNNRISAGSQILATLGEDANSTVSTGNPVLGTVKAATSGSATIEIVNTSATGGSALSGSAVVNFIVLS